MSNTTLDQLHDFVDAEASEPTGLNYVMVIVEREGPDGVKTTRQLSYDPPPDEAAG